MKGIYKSTIIALTALLGAAVLQGCKQEQMEIVNTPAIDVTTQKLSPSADESGTVRAYIGTAVNAKGFNLDRVGLVTMDGVEAPIVEQTISSITFEVPELSFAQADSPYRVLLEVFDADKTTTVFKYDYYITVPVTDALVTSYSPKEGTVGTEVTLVGRNLEQVTRVSIGSAEVSDAAFVSKDASKLVFAVPAMSTSAANTELTIAAIWGGSNSIDVTVDSKFTLHVPAFAAFSQDSAARLGDEVLLTGDNLDLVQGIKWGETEMLISEQSASSITIKVPSGIEKTDPVIVSAALTASYGEPLQSVVISNDFKIDTTPIGPAAPVFTSAAPSLSDYTNIYLGAEVTVRGENMASIEGFEVDGQAVTLSQSATDIDARFVVPSGIGGLSARDVTLVAIWGGGNRADFGTIRVYPFYYTRGLKMGLGSNSKSTYPEFAAEHAFLQLNEGRVISAAQWKEDGVDSFAESGSNSVVTAANKVTGTEEQYYSVAPYIFATASSSNKLQLNNPANSNSQLKCHRIEGTSLPSTFGTPVLFMRVMTDAEIKAAVSEGSLDTIWDSSTLGSSAAPAFGKSESSSTWVKGSVILVQYLNYAHVSTTGGKPTDASNILRTGYLYIRDITCADEATGLALASREGYIEMDLYWSQSLN